jgi:hypothetical protein
MPQENRRQNENTSQGETVGALTPEVIKEVAEKVFALMLKDLKISRERYRSGLQHYDQKGRKK